MSKAVAVAQAARPSGRRCFSGDSRGNGSAEKRGKVEMGKRYNCGADPAKLYKIYGGGGKEAGVYGKD